MTRGGTTPVIDETTQDIRVVSPVPSSADTVPVPWPEDEITRNQAQNDYINDPLAPSQFREQELAYLGQNPQIDPTLSIQTGLLQQNLKFVFDVHFGKFYATMVILDVRQFRGRIGTDVA